MPTKKRLLMVGGGTAGHIIPNLAIVDKLSARCHSRLQIDPSSLSLATSNRSSNHSSIGSSAKRVLSEAGPQLEILYVGSRKASDRKMVESAGVRFKSIFTGKLRRYFSWKNFTDPVFLAIGFLQSLYIMATFRPQLVFSKGGYVSVPVVLAARLFRVKIILHESDSVVGLANRICARFADSIYVSFPYLADEKTYFYSGNPVRDSILKGDSKKGYRLTGFKKRKPVLLVWGGSQGADQINQMVHKEFRRLTSSFQVVHVTGVGKKTALKHENYCQFEYLQDDLKHIYAITSLVVGRAGANSLFEVAMLKLPNVVVPLKNPDQLNNAKYFEKQGATVILKGRNSLTKNLLALWRSRKKRSEMVDALEKVSSFDAAKKLANVLIENLRGV